MVDSQFFPSAGPLTLSAIAELTGAELQPDTQGKILIQGVAPLDRAGPGQVSFLDNSKYIHTFTQSLAGACFVRAKHAPKAPEHMTLLVCDDPYYCYAITAEALYPIRSVKAEISPHAHIHSSATIGKNAHIEPGVVIGANVTIGMNCILRANAVIHDNVKIGDGCSIGANSTLSHALLGNRVILHRGVHIGQDGFGYAFGREGHLKVPQLGRVIIEDDVEIGSGSCVDRGAGPDTIIGRGTKIDNLVQIGHNVQIGRQAIIVAQTGVAGSSKIGDGVMLGGQTGISGHLKIGAGARLAAQSGALTDIPPGSTYGGYPAVPIKDWHRQTIALSRLIRKKGPDDD